MRYVALACDYDGTLARHGTIDQPTVAALERLRASGRKLILVTGRELDDLMRVCPHVHLFDRVVAENGGLLCNPATSHLQLLAEPPPEEFVRLLEQRGVAASVGRVIVATSEPHDAVVFQAIRNLHLELQVIFNKGAVMVLPTGVNKSSGLRRALEELKLSLHNTVGVGDAENDHAFLTACERSFAVANALDSVKARVDVVTASDHGAGVVELIDRMVDSDLAELSARVKRHDLVVGESETGTDVRVAQDDSLILIAGPSESSRRAVTMTLLERLCETAYQFCVVDSNGAYQDFGGAIALRGGDRTILAEEVLRVLDHPSENAVVSLLDLPVEDRLPFFDMLLPRLSQFRASAGRPHWIVMDDTHQLLPSSRPAADVVLSPQRANTVLITAHPNDVSAAVLRLVETVITVGDSPQTTLDALNRARGSASRFLPFHQQGGTLAWFVRIGAPPVPFRIAASAERRRQQEP